jgi:hypothetical protein
MFPWRLWGKVTDCCLYRLFGFWGEGNVVEIIFFTTGGLPPFRSCWCPWDSRPEIFFSTELLRTYSLCNFLSDEKMSLSLMNVLGLSSRVRIVHTVCYWKSVLLYYIQVFCQYSLCKADHAYLNYLILQRPLSHFNGRKLDHRQV